MPSDSQNLSGGPNFPETVSTSSTLEDGEGKSAAAAAAISHCSAELKICDSYSKQKRSGVLRIRAFRTRTGKRVFQIGPLFVDIKVFIFTLYLTAAICLLVTSAFKAQTESEKPIWMQLMFFSGGWLFPSPGLPTRSREEQDDLDSASEEEDKREKFTQVLTSLLAENKNFDPTTVVNLLNSI